MPQRGAHTQRTIGHAAVLGGAWTLAGLAHGIHPRGSLQLSAPTSHGCLATQLYERSITHTCPHQTQPFKPQTNTVLTLTVLEESILVFGGTMVVKVATVVHNVF